MASSKASLALLFCIFPQLALAQDVEFIFHGFNGTGTDLIREGATIIKPTTGALRLTNKSQNVIGHAFYHQPIQMFDINTSSNSSRDTSFSTNFVFSIVPSSPGHGGFGLAFTLSPSPSFPEAEPGHYLGIFNSKNDGNSSNHIFAVEFDTVNGHNDKDDRQGNHVGININGVNSTKAEPAYYYINDKKEEFALEDDKPVHVWVDYDGVEKIVNVTICPLDEEKPTQPLMSLPINLTDWVKETMYVAFSASTGTKASSHYILGWSFSTIGEAPALNLSLLPSAPGEKSSSSSYKPQIIVFIAALSVVTLLLLVLLISLTVYMLGKQKTTQYAANNK